MNFLAHIYLSGDNDLIKIGNFMADGIRGKEYENYPDAIQKGILLHRAIDTYTDSHDVFRQSTKRLHEKYHHYAAACFSFFLIKAGNAFPVHHKIAGQNRQAFRPSISPSFLPGNDRKKHQQ